MNIISEGVWTRQVFCNSCQSLLEVEKDDVVSFRLGCCDDFKPEYFVRCCSCQTLISIGTDIPDHVKADANSRK